MARSSMNSLKHPGSRKQVNKHSDLESIFGENLFDEFFNDFPFYDDKEERRLEKKLYGRRAQNLMKTDIKEMDQGYEMEIDLPGFKKEDIQASIQNGYLTISATKGLEKEEKDNDNGHYIRRALCRHLREKLLCRRKCNTGGY